MATDKVVVSRMALAHIGARSNIESLDELGAEPKAAKLWFDQARKQVLEAFDWSFARKRLTLATHGDAPPTGEWAYRYQYPADAIMIRRIVNPVLSLGDAPPFEIETSVNGTLSIVTNVNGACAVYTFDQQQLDLYSPLAILALSYALAHLMSNNLSTRQELAKQQRLNFLRTVQAARASDGNQHMPKPIRDAEWIRAR